MPGENAEIVEKELSGEVQPTDEVITAEPEQEQESQPDPKEVEARAQGWVPIEEWKGPKEKWRPLDEFLDVGERIKRSHRELRDELKSQQAHNQELKNAIDTLIAGQEEIRRQERQKVIAELEKQKVEAITDGDVEKVKQLDRAIDQEKTEAAKPLPQQQKIPQEIASWKERNPWYDTNTHAQAFANAVDQECASKGIGVEESLKIVEAEVKKRFPELFPELQQTAQSTPARPASPVESGGRRSAGKSSKVTKLEDLNPVAQKIAKDFDAKGIMTIDEYIKQYNSQEIKK